VFTSVQISVGAALSPTQRTAVSENFHGCVENLFYNGVNLIDLAVRKDQQVAMTVGSITDLCLFHTYFPLNDWDNLSSATGDLSLFTHAATLWNIPTLRLFTHDITMSE